MHYRLRLLAFPIRARRRLCLWPDVRSLRFQRVPFRRDVAFDPGGATAPRITVPHMLPSTIMTGSASATLSISRLNPTPQRIAVYASQSPSPTPTQHSLPGGPLRPYPCRSSTGWNTPASPDAPQAPDSTGFLPDPCNKVAPSSIRFERQEGCPCMVEGPRPGFILPDAAQAGDRCNKASSSR